MEEICYKRLKEAAACVTHMGHNGAWGTRVSEGPVDG